MQWRAPGIRRVMKLVRPWTTGPLALLLSTMLRTWMRTLQFQYVWDDPSVNPARMKARGIYVFWHEMMILPAYTYGRRNVAVLVSQHRDGELIARVLKMLGFDVVRGSTSRQGLSGLRGMMRQGKSRHLAITVITARRFRRRLRTYKLAPSATTGVAQLTSISPAAHLAGGQDR